MGYHIRHCRRSIFTVDTSFCAKHVFPDGWACFILQQLQENSEASGVCRTAGCTCASAVIYERGLQSAILKLTALRTSGAGEGLMAAYISAAHRSGPPCSCSVGTALCIMSLMSATAAALCMGALSGCGAGGAVAVVLVCAAAAEVRSLRRAWRPGFAAVAAPGAGLLHRWRRLVGV